MSGLTERYVQDVSLDFLKKHYNDKYKPTKMFCRKEVVTRYKNQKGRADGVVAFKNEGKVYTISLEAKSHKTFNSLLTQNNDTVWVSLGFIMLFLIFVSALFLLWKYNWIIKIGVSACMGVLISFAFMFLIEEKGYLKKHGIIEQVRRYPANEQWIAFSKDAYNYFDKINDYELKVRAKRYGIGIIIVSKGQKVDIELSPRISGLKGRINFLKYYSIGAKIEQELI